MYKSGCYKIFIFIAFLIVCVSREVIAQKTPQNLAAWVGYEMYLPFKEDGRWGLLLEGYAKGNNFLQQSQGSFYRIGANYYLKNGNRFGAGYAYQWNIPYDDVSLPYSNPDYRIYEQFIWRIVKKDGDVVWSQRFRMEQRWLGRKNDPDDSGFDYYKFENTFRYQLRYQWWFKPRLAAVGYDEVHIRTNALSSGEKFLDQNRFYLGSAYSLDKHREIRMELGYMNQSFWKSVDTEEGRSRVNHVIRITLTTDLPLKHKSKHD
jgi:hypothetical protein